MYKWFEKNSITAYLLTAVVIILSAIRVFHTGELLLENRGSVFFNTIFEVSVWNVVFIKLLIVSFHLLSLGLYLTIYRRFSFYEKNPSLILYIVSVNTLIGLLFPFTLEYVLCNFLFLLFSIYIQGIEQKKDTTVDFYWLGAYFILSICLSFSNTILAIPFLFTVFIYGKSGARDVLGILLGAGVIFSLLWSVELWRSPHWTLFDSFRPYLNFQYQLPQRWEWAAIVILILSALGSFKTIGLSNIQTRKYFTFLFFVLVCALLFTIFLSQAKTRNVSTLLMLTNFYLPPFILNIRNKILKSVFLFFGLILAIFATFVRL